MYYLLKDKNTTPRELVLLETAESYDMAILKAHELNNKLGVPITIKKDYMNYGYLSVDIIGLKNENILSSEDSKAIITEAMETPSEEAIKENEDRLEKLSEIFR